MGAHGYGISLQVLNLIEVYVCVFSIDLQCKCFHTTVIEVHYCSNESTVHSK